MVSFLPECPQSTSHTQTKLVAWHPSWVGLVAGDLGQVRVHRFLVGALALVKMHSAEHLIQPKWLQSQGLWRP